MSSRYQAEKLSVAMMEAILVLLAQGTKLAFQPLYRAVRRSLAAHHRLSQAAKVDEQALRRQLHYMKRNKLIELEGRAEEVEVRITGKGRERLERMSFETVTLAKNQRWDHKWRVVTFDIPEDRRRARDALRRLLKQMGFRQLHLSVWVLPFPCRAQIDKLQKVYGVEKHITLLEVDSFDRADEFKQLFAMQLG